MSQHAGRTGMWRALVPALAIAALATPAAAQAPKLNLIQQGAHLKTDREVAQEKERETGYKSGLAKIPDTKARDPWGGVRDTPAAQRGARPGAN